MPTNVLTNMLRAPPLSLYVHMPWCVRKCPYCDFNSHAAPERIPQSQYVDALLRDLDTDLADVDGRELASIFFGGGTPSLFDPEEIARLLAGVRAHIAFAHDIEITLEANPGTIEHGRFSGYRAAGINRVSLGAQTFNEAQLQVLGRIHGRGDIGRAVDELVRAGLDNFNLDLMYGLPSQTVEQSLADVDAALALGPAHISHYQLTLEPGTVFYHRPPALPDPELIWEMQVRCQERLATHDYRHYEVSAYARAGRTSRHNLNYWRFGDYLGIGAGAHGKLTRAARGEIVRTARLRQPREYLGREGEERIDLRHAVAIRDRPFEYMLNALRLVEGFDERAFETRTGVSFATIAPVAEAARHKKLLATDARGSWRPTELGQRFLNDLQQMFLPESGPGAHPSQDTAADK
jgi:oxygen-independent coproporphyrinogen-3 oxidase